VLDRSSTKKSVCTNDKGCILKTMLTIFLLSSPSLAVTLWSEPEVIGELEASALDELSGLASSGVTPGLMWGINDSPDPILFAIGEDGADVDRLWIDGVENYDWEDLSSAPCPDIADACSCLFVADTGDDSNDREHGLILIVPEPLTGTFGSKTEAPIEIWFTTPRGFIDFEAMVVEPDTLDIFLFEKTTDFLAEVYRISGPHLPNSEDSPLMASQIATLELTSVTESAIGGASISPDGRMLVLRTDSYLFLFEGDSGVEEMLTRPPSSIPTVVDPNGEAVAFSFDGGAIYLSGEGDNADISAIFMEPALTTTRLTEQCELTATCGCTTATKGRASNALVSLISLFGLLIFRRRS
jgi:MYXO-CTERM domain-containing protein